MLAAPIRLESVLYLPYWSHDPYRFKREQEQLDVLYSWKRTARTTFIADHQHCRTAVQTFPSEARDIGYDVTFFYSSVPWKPVYSPLARKTIPGSQHEGGEVGGSSPPFCTLSCPLRTPPFLPHSSPTCTPLPSLLPLPHLSSAHFLTSHRLLG